MSSASGPASTKKTTTSVNREVHKGRLDRKKARSYIHDNVEHVLQEKYTRQKMHTLLDVLDALIDRMGEGKNYCWPSYDDMARKLRCSAKTVQRATDELHSIGIITKKLRYYHNSPEYYWTPKYFEEWTQMSSLESGKSGHGSPARVDTNVHLTTSKENHSKGKPKKKTGQRKIVIKKSGSTSSSEDPNLSKKEEWTQMSSLEYEEPDVSDCATESSAKAKGWTGCEKHKNLEDGIDKDCDGCKAIDKKNKGF